MSKKVPLGPLDTFLQQDAAFAEEVRLFKTAHRIAVALKNMRLAADLTQAQLAKKMGVTQGRVSQIESGLRDHLPSVETMMRYSKACDEMLSLAFADDEVAVCAIPKALASGKERKRSVGVVFSLQSEAPVIEKMLNAAHKSHPGEITKQRDGTFRVKGGIALGIMNCLKFST